MSEEAEAAASTADEILVVTSPQISGKRIERTYGLVSGNTIRARHIGKDIMAGLRNIVGGEVVEYAKLLAESRERAPGSNEKKGRGPGGQCHHQPAVSDVGDHGRGGRDDGLWHRGLGRRR
ncbi:MAG: hypothetical protein CM1200mP2_19580 [Planctomycetaceae bacterium]|nr:MAG: hypothetical protein CM1200mP2_19580 [Planctomycetaceae bacterium]